MSEKQGCSGTAIAIIAVSFVALMLLGVAGAFFAYKSVSTAADGNEEALREFVRAAAAGEQTAARAFIAQSAADASGEGAILAGISDLGGYGAMQTFEIDSTGFQSNLGTPTVWSYTGDVTYEHGAGDLEFDIIKVGDTPRIQRFSYNIRALNAPAETGGPAAPGQSDTPAAAANQAASPAAAQQAANPAATPPAANPATPPAANPATPPSQQQPLAQAASNISAADEQLVRTFFDATAARNFRAMFSLMSSAGQAAIDQQVTNAQISGLPNWGAVVSMGNVALERSVDSPEFGRVRVMTLAGNTATTSLRLTLEVGRENGSPVAHRFDLAYDPIGQPAGGKP